MQERVAGPIREFDKPGVLAQVIPFHFRQHRRRGGWFLVRWFSNIRVGLVNASYRFQVILRDNLPSLGIRVSSAVQGRISLLL